MCKAENIIVSAPSENNKKPWREIGAAITTDNSKLIKNVLFFVKQVEYFIKFIVLDAVFCNCKIVFLATKPQYFPKVVSELHTESPGLPLNILISIMAGITLSELQGVSQSIYNILMHYYNRY